MLLHELGASCSMFRWWKKKDIFRKFDRNSSLFIIWLVRCQIEGKMIIRNPINENWIYSVIVWNTKSRNRFFYECFYWDYSGDNVTYMFCIHARKDLFSFPSDIKHLCHLQYEWRTNFLLKIFSVIGFIIGINGEHCEVSK